MNHTDLLFFIFGSCLMQMFALHYQYFFKHSSLNPTFALDTDVTLENEVLGDSLALPLDT